MKKALMSYDDINQFENYIYLPMVLTVLLKDKQRIEAGGFKLPGTYLQLIDQAVKRVEADLRETKAYLKKRHLKMIQGERDDFATVYIFFHDGYEDKRKYANLRLRNRTEELMEVYLEKGRME